MFDNTQTYKMKIEYIKKIDLILREEILKEIINKEGINNVEIEIIRGVHNRKTFIYLKNNNFITNYKPVYKCKYKKTNGQNVVRYIKPNITNLYGYSLKNSTDNEETGFSLIEIGTMGYTIPEFVYSKNLIIDVEKNKNKKIYSFIGNRSKIKFNVLKIKNTKIKFNVLITKNVEEIIDKQYLNLNKEEIIKISKIEAIDRLILQSYGINDNKTSNVKIYEKINGKNKSIFFDPNFFIENNLTMLYHFIEIAFFRSHIIKNFANTNFGVLKEQNYETFEYHAIEIFVDFLRNQIKEKDKFERYSEYIKILDNFDLLNLNKIIEIGKFFKIIYEKNKNDYFSSYNFYTFLEQKKEELMEKEKEIEELLKKAYYYKKNRKTIFQKLNKINNKIDQYLKNIYTGNYQPVILSNLVGKTYNNMSLLNFKQPKGILDLKEKENGDFKVKQLYKENRKLEDMTILIDNSKFTNIELKENRRIIQNIILNELIDLANNKNISLSELSYLILKSINMGDKYLNEDEKNISEQFKKNMESKGIFSTIKIKNQNNNSIKFEKLGGLELKNLSKSIIELLIDKKEKFEIKSRDTQEKLNKDLKRRDRNILERTIEEFDNKQQNIEDNFKIYNNLVF